MVIVTGATGKGNGGTRARARARARGVPVRALVLSAKKAATFAGLDAETAIGDLEDGASVAAALAGTDHLFLLTANLSNQLELE